MTPSADLELPLALSGPWENALFLSYGLDLPFFERTILPNLPGSCRNRILLGDEKTYLTSCDHFAESGLVRYANSQYVAEPILRRPSSHAKLVLLTGTDAGWLALGSGNVSIQGFASGGELFTAYTYTAEDEAALAEFVAVRQLLERFRENDLLTRTAAWHVDHLLEGSPWMFRPAAGAPRVRHNLDTSFLNQLSDVIGGEHVDHLWVLAPFFDPEVRALSDLVDRLRPDLTTVLLQPGRASVEPAALAKLIDAAGKPLELRSANRPDDAWIHAKLFLAQTATGSICLQGSANASIAALVRTDPGGNFEMANLLRGTRDAFDDVLDGLQIGDAVTDATTLDLTYQSSEEKDHLDEAGWQLTGAEWSDGLLRVSYRGVLPSTHNLHLIVRATALAAEVAEEGPPLVLRFADEKREFLGGADPIRLQFADGTRSNAVFPCDRSALSATLHASAEGDERLSRIGHLDLDDDELELLLQELESTMVLDRRSLWQLAGNRGATEEPPEGEELHLDYTDVDYEMLHAHPKLRQYLTGSRGSGMYGKSRLQLVLHAITSSFADLLEPAHAGDTAAAVAALAAEGDKGVETDDPESGGDETEVHRRRWSRQARINVLLKNFIQRFVAGLSSTAFQDFAGPEVVASNYVIFLHLLARLYEREWVDVNALTDAAAATIEAMWGSASSDGYVARLKAEESQTVLSMVREKHSDAQLLALVYVYARDVRLAHSRELRTRMRDAWRALLLGARLPLDASALRDVAVLLRPLGAPPLSDVTEELRALADYRTRAELLNDLQARFADRAARWRFDKVNVMIPSRGQTANEECLLVEDDGMTFSLDDAQWTLAAWMQVETRSYFRVQVMSRERSSTARFVAFYEPDAQRGAYAALGPGAQAIALTKLHAPAAPWDEAILDLMSAAEQVDAAASPPVEHAAG